MQHVMLFACLRQCNVSVHGHRLELCLACFVSTLSGLYSKAKRYMQLDANLDS